MSAKSWAPLIAVSVTLIAALVAVEPAGAASTEKRRVVLKPATQEAWITTDPTMTFGALWTDFDRNGYPDLFINRHYQAPWFHRFAGARHEYYRYHFDTQNGWDADDEFVDRHGCAWGEADGRGNPDLYCTQGANKGTGRGANQLFLTTGARFDESAVRMRVHDPLGRGRTVNWLDYDVDGDLDLFVTNAVRKGSTNRMFRNDRGSFKEVAVGIAPSATEWPGSTVADWDNDGDPDILLLDGHEGPAAYRNDGGAFERVTTGIPHEAWISATWADYDGDGWTDVHLVGRTSAVVMKNVAGTFVPAHEQTLDFGRTSAWFDVENDGDLDLFVVQGTPPPASAKKANRADFVLVNDGATFTKVTSPSFRGPRNGNGDQVITSDYDRDGRTDVFVTNGHNPSAFTGPSMLLRNIGDAANSITIRLKGQRWNPFGTGARILVEAGGSARWYVVTDGVTHRGQSEVDNLVAGIGDAAAATLMVVWPGGGRDCFEATSGAITVAAEGRSPCPLGA